MKKNHQTQKKRNICDNTATQYYAWLDSTLDWSERGRKEKHIMPSSFTQSSFFCFAFLVLFCPHHTQNDRSFTSQLFFSSFKLKVNFHLIHVRLIFKLLSFFIRVRIRNSSHFLCLCICFYGLQVISWWRSIRFIIIVLSNDR